MFEDLLVFFQEISETLTDVILLAFACFDQIVEFVSSIFETTGNNISKFVGIITSSCSFIYNVIAHCVQNFGDLFNLIGRSIILLLNLVPRTIYMLYVGSSKLFKSSKNFISNSLSTVHTTISTASPELLLGIIVGTLALVFITKYTIKTIRDRNITWRSLLRAALWLICTTYIIIFRSIAR